MVPKYGFESHSASVAHSGNFSFAAQTPWIIDSNATYHMTGSSHLFDSYCPYLKKYSVKIADGTQSPIAGIGTIKLSIDLLLKSILYVPSLKCNLISVHKLTSDNNCLAKIVSNSCQFQDLSSGRMIGSARIHDRLYFFDKQHPINKVPSTHPSNTQSDLDIPTALRKGTRSFTQHLILKFISYSKLSSPFKAFTSTLLDVVIPRNINEALDTPQWKAAVLEEIKAL
ncbi:uncharacterized protein LOC133805830 [Humulus lupulus]|uniref:uncharacterized protein LOC133805830 n=1 Tax=Humulus lupulus TaxID=3486 RepID=UPI002B411A40|nr:uncharacterized protein LOC133805830 [Humulus lupulus]